MSQIANSSKYFSYEPRADISHVGRLVFRFSDRLVSNNQITSTAMIVNRVAVGLQHPTAQLRYRHLFNASVSHLTLRRSSELQRIAAGRW